MKLFERLKIKKIDEDIINESINKIRSVITETIATIQIGGEKFSFWPLFLSEKGGKYSPSDIDTCATSLGTKTLLGLTEKPMLTQSKSVLQNSCRTILFMRNNDGSWPSIFYPSTEKPSQMEGVLNDTTYALECLIDLGFLNYEPEITLENAKYDLKDRINFVMESVQWLLDNRVGNGWDYIGVEYLEETEFSTPSILPTSNVIVILDKVIRSLQVLDRHHPLLEQVKNAYNEAISWLKDTQTKGDFGKKKGDKPTIVHTAIGVNALLTDAENSKKEILMGIKWILKNKHILTLNKLEDEHVFDEYDQIIFIDKNNVRRRIIKHENFLEGVLLNVLMEVDKKGLINRLSFYQKYRFRKVVKYLLFELLNRQVEAGRLEGAFKTRRSAPAEKYPIYALYFSALGLKALKENIKNILKKPSFITVILMASGLATFFALMSWGISWTFNLTLEKAVGFFIIESAIALLASIFKQRII